MKEVWKAACPATGGPHEWKTVSIERMSGPNGTTFHRSLRQCRCGKLQYQDTEAD